jgi:predicted acetyltransferase
MEAVLLDCDKDNLGSSKTMRALGGKLIYEYYDENEGHEIQNYVIDVEAALEKYKDQYEPFISK